MRIDPNDLDPADSEEIGLDLETVKRLNEPFPDGEILNRKVGGGRTIYYVDARVVADRLDGVVGPENWSDSYRTVYIGDPGTRPAMRDVWGGAQGQRQVIGQEEYEQKYQYVSIECELTVLGVTKVDVGSAETEDEPVKAAYSDAFKRAAQKFGVARYLYHKDQRPDEPTQAASSGTGRSDAAPGGGQRPASVAPQNAGAPPTDAQLRALFTNGNKIHGWDDYETAEWCRETYGAVPEQLTRATVSQAIDRIKQP